MVAPMMDTTPEQDGNADPYPPLLRKLLEEYAATGIPPAYIPREASNE